MRNYSTIVGAIKRRNPEAGNVVAFDVPRKSVEYVEHENRRPDIRIYATTEDVDMEGDVIVAAGVDVGTYMQRNRNLFVDHDYGITAAVAYARTLTLDSRGWIVTAQLTDNDNEYQRAVVALAKAGTLAMSVGADMTEVDKPTPEEQAKWVGVKRVARRCVMLEASFTAMPMNPHARQIGEWRDKSVTAIKSAGLPDRVLDVFRLPRMTRRVIIL